MLRRYGQHRLSKKIFQAAADNKPLPAAAVFARHVKGASGVFRRRQVSDATELEDKYFRRGTRQPRVPLGYSSSLLRTITRRLGTAQFPDSAEMDHFPLRFA